MSRSEGKESLSISHPLRVGLTIQLLGNIDLQLQGCHAREVSDPTYIAHHPAELFPLKKNLVKSQLSLRSCYLFHWGEFHHLSFLPFTLCVYEHSINSILKNPLDASLRLGRGILNKVLGVVLPSTVCSNEGVRRWWVRFAILYLSVHSLLLCMQNLFTPPLVVQVLLNILNQDVNSFIEVLGNVKGDALRQLMLRREHVIVCLGNFHGHMVR